MGGSNRTLALTGSFQVVIALSDPYSLSVGIARRREDWLEKW